MSRKVLPLTLDRFAALSAPCRSCLFWELDPVRRRRLDQHRAIAQKEAWFSEVLRDWGSCGRVAVVDGEPVGYLVYAPPAYVPGAASYPTAPVSPDAVLLTTVWIDPRHAGGGLGRMLVQGMAKELVNRDVGAVEAFGATRPREGECILPAEFLSAVGFRTHRTHPRYPRMRMDLRTTLTWREELEVVLGKLVGVVGKRPVPQPQSRSRYS
jgi:GNAT superfamily N-acetyltransferase